MTDKKLTDEEIIKALECHINAEDCVGCEMFGRCDEIILTKLVLDLINRQKGEIETLKSANNEKFRQWDMLAEKTKQHYADLYNEAKDILKAEAYKEFAERLKKETLSDRGYDILQQGTIDNILKEMVGEEE